MKTRVYERGVQSFYDDLSTFLCNTASLGIAIDAVKRGSYGGFAGNPDHYLEFEGRKVCKTFTWRPYAAIALIADGRWPERIEFSEDASVHVQGGPRISSMMGIISTALAAAFVHYFESQHDRIRSKYGDQPYSWPAELNFARVIRNAFAHGGSISFLNPSALPVSWMGITYSPADNGRSILFQDIGLVEPILLMEEIDLLTK